MLEAKDLDDFLLGDNTKEMSDIIAPGFAGEEDEDEEVKELNEAGDHDASEMSDPFGENEDEVRDLPVIGKKNIYKNKQKVTISDEDDEEDDTRMLRGRKNEEKEMPVAKSIISKAPGSIVPMKETKFAEKKSKKMKLVKNEEVQHKSLVGMQRQQTRP